MPSKGCLCITATVLVAVGLALFFLVPRQVEMKEFRSQQGASPLGFANGLFAANMEARVDNINWVDIAVEDVDAKIMYGEYYLANVFLEEGDDAVVLARRNETLLPLKLTLNSMGVLDTAAAAAQVIADCLNSNNLKITFEGEWEVTYLGITTNRSRTEEVNLSCV